MAQYVTIAAFATFVVSGFLYVIGRVFGIPFEAIDPESPLARTARETLAYLQKNYDDYLPIVGAVPAVLQQKHASHLLPLCEVILFLGLSVIAISSIASAVALLARMVSDILAAERTERGPVLPHLRSAAAMVAGTAVLVFVLELFQSNASNVLLRNLGSDDHQPGAALIVWLGGFYLVFTIFIYVALRAFRESLFLILPGRKS